MKTLSKNVSATIRNHENQDHGTPLCLNICELLLRDPYVCTFSVNVNISVDVDILYFELLPG